MDLVPEVTQLDSMSGGTEDHSQNHQIGGCYVLADQYLMGALSLG